MQLFVFGLGYTARVFAGNLVRQGTRIVATVRSFEQAEQLSGGAQTVRVFSDRDADPQIAQDLQQSDALLISVPPRDGKDPVLTRWSQMIAEAKNLRWIGYLSTVGVYGDHRGGWVDETTPVMPTLERSRWRAASERAWLLLGTELGLPVHCFRLAGIYGPGRNALRRVAAGKARRIVKAGQVFNRIHVDDIVQVLAASLARPRSGAIYNVADNEPAPPQDVIAFAADLCGCPPPPAIPFETAELGAMARSFYNDNKRVRNALLACELNVTLKYPTYREGLTALWRSGEAFSNPRDDN